MHIYVFWPVFLWTAIINGIYAQETINTTVLVQAEVLKELQQSGVDWTAATRRSTIETLDGLKEYDETFIKLYILGALSLGWGLTTETPSLRLTSDYYRWGFEDGRDAAYAVVRLCRRRARESLINEVKNKVDSAPGEAGAEEKVQVLYAGKCS